MFDGQRSDMSYAIYHNLFKTENQGMDKEGGEMLEEIFEGEDDYRTQTDSNTNRQLPFQFAGRYVRIRSYRSVTVCLVLLCVLLLTAVIVLCVLINTNNQQCHIETKNITEERDEIIAKYNNITKLSEQLNQEKIELWTHLQAGWIYYQSSLYYSSSEQKNWTDSRRYCKERGADLTIINNKEEQDFISGKSGTDNIWIGLSDIEVEGRWKWVDGSTLTTSFWKVTQPQGVEDENCVVNHLSVWSDYFCYAAFKFICETKRLN
ncbi:CD209 antigen-like protein C [Misgurnus anguillicaudatus]|uniref:CD209 antigen-like protein C n=1 Tax=Misgurnus anguillicaudatus TaxID=75329 RepID=UPI003CCF741E